MNPPDEYVQTEADHLAITEGCYWDEAEANKHVVFTERFFRSQFINGPITLRQNQRDLLRRLYG